MKLIHFCTKYFISGHLVLCTVGGAQMGGLKFAPNLESRRATPADAIPHKVYNIVFAPFL
jgi:hypothetical protein